MDKGGLEGIEFNHSVPVQVRFSDIDMVGHVNNAVQVMYLDYGKVKYYEAVKKKALDWKSAEFVMVNINVDFVEPIYLEEKIEVKTKITEIGNKSVKMVQAIVSDKGRVKTVAHNVMCGFDPVECVGVCVSEEWRDLINNFEKYRP